MAEGDLIRMGIGIDTLSLDHGPSKDFPTRQFTHFAPFSVSPQNICCHLNQR
jgi:hypothetical protein